MSSASGIETAMMLGLDSCVSSRATSTNASSAGETWAEVLGGRRVAVAARYHGNACRALPLTLHGHDELDSIGTEAPAQGAERASGRSQRGGPWFETHVGGSDALATGWACPSNAKRLAVASDAPHM
jgi:hypothetical protein